MISQLRQGFHECKTCKDILKFKQCTQQSSSKIENAYGRQKSWVRVLILHTVPICQKVSVIYLETMVKVNHHFKMNS